MCKYTIKYYFYYIYKCTTLAALAAPLPLRGAVEFIFLCLIYAIEFLFRKWKYKKSAFLLGSIFAYFQMNLNYTYT